MTQMVRGTVNKSYFTVEEHAKAQSLIYKLSIIIDKGKSLTNDTTITCEVKNEILSGIFSQLEDEIRPLLTQFKRE